MDILIIKWLLNRKKYGWCNASDESSLYVHLQIFKSTDSLPNLPNLSGAVVKFHINFVQLVFPRSIFKLYLLNHNSYFPFSEILSNFRVWNHNCQHSWLILQNLDISSWNNAPFALSVLGQSVDRNNITRPLLSYKYLR